MTTRLVIRNAEKESALAAPLPRRYERQTTIFNSIVEDPRLRAREAEWLAVSHGRTREDG